MAMLAVMSVPDAYGLVEAGVYRASALTPHNLPFLLQLRLKTLLHLSTEHPLPAIVDLLDKCGTKFIHLGARQGKRLSTWKPVSEDLVKDALEFVLDANTHPIMVTCSTGIHQTGTLVGCLRRLQKWNLTSIMEEYRRYAGRKARYANEQFMELFDENLISLPKYIPAWLIDQQRMMKEEEAEFNRRRKSTDVSNLQDDASVAFPMVAPLNVSSSGLEQGVQGSEDMTLVTSKDCTSEQRGFLKSEKLPSYARYYFSCSSPLTTDTHSYKRKLIAHVE
ncbi:hypothetical protein O6H91_01G036200 [Diphasiastrum complanatum]|uniref:Uncharacterized protein n=2 Tax=Diphasiastrum complanatum TaxID=34168 RepID=A0ACC2EPW3_DIPCM|nr:hypothetical protein O6H91_01G036200 [Diphasiastrum complanatum]KAJ7568523.1 hypothetical protein O6H91_01G036200 [Diphasiastrum complanatum]